VLNNLFIKSAQNVTNLCSRYHSGHESYA
jgi:hypothetical protein